MSKEMLSDMNDFELSKMVKDLDLCTNIPTILEWIQNMSHFPSYDKIVRIRVIGLKPPFELSNDEGNDLLMGLIILRSLYNALRKAKNSNISPKDLK